MGDLSWWRHQLLPTGFPPWRHCWISPAHFPHPAAPPLGSKARNGSQAPFFQLHSQTPLFSSSWQMGRGSENVANFQLFSTRSFTFSAILRLLQTKAGPLCCSAGDSQAWLVISPVRNSILFLCSVWDNVIYYKFKKYMLNNQGKKLL